MISLREGIEALPHQLEDSDLAVKARYSINASEMGTGKTLTGIIAALKIGGAALIVVPPTLAHQWESEIQKFTTATVCNLHKKQKYEGQTFCIATYTALDKLEELWGKFSIVVADEAHYLKNPRTKRTEKFIDFVRRMPPKHLLLTTGTPIKNRIPEYYTLLYLMSFGPHQVLSKDFQGVRCRFPSYYTFCSYFANPRTVRVNGIHITQYSGMRNVDELKNYIRPLYTRRNSLSAHVPQDKLVEVDYREDPTLMSIWEAYESGKGAIDITRKEQTAVAKAKFTSEYVRGILEEEGPVIVLSDHKKSVEMMALELSDFRVKYIHSDIPIKKRDEYIHMFRKGQLDVLIGTIGTLGTGHNLVEARHMVFNDVSWVPGDNAQARKRIDRIGQTKKPMYHYIVGSRTDKFIWKKLRDKEKVIKEVLDVA